MPLEAIGEVVVRVVAEAILELARYGTGRVIIPLATLGRVKVEPAPKRVKVYPKWHGFGRTSGGEIYAAPEMTALLGLIFWVVVIVLGVTAYSLAP